MNREKQERAANDLEDLKAPLTEIVRHLRMAQSDDMAYALVYELRRQISRIVSELGSGVPSTQAKARANDIIDEQIWIAGTKD